MTMLGLALVAFGLVRRRRRARRFCACEHLNPTGECCLADSHRAVKQLQVERPRERVADDALQLIERS